MWYTCYTLDSGIDVAPGINVAPPLKKFHITILILFYINLGIAVIFDFIFSSRMGQNFDDYSGFQPKTTAAYATQCITVK